MSSILRTLSILSLLLLPGTLSAQPDCSYCRKPIEGSYLTTDEKTYHESCYRDHIQPRCAHCNELISGKYTLLDGKKYHSDCYIENIIPRCDICGGPLQGTYYTDFWGNSFHSIHSDELSECYTCGRLICNNLTNGGYALSDGRSLCRICNETAVTDDFLLGSSMSEVKRMLRYNGIDDLPDNIPVTLVDRTTLKKLAQSNSDAMHGFTDLKVQTINGKIVSRESRIYILSHLPFLMFKAVLAHELLHVYLFQNDLDLRSDIREGFCNLGSEMVYKKDNSEYARFRLANMQESPDPDYGIGYRKMSRELERKGWDYLLETLGSIK